MATNLSELIELGGSVATVATAYELGLVDSLSHPAPPAEHAERLDLDPEAVELVLDLLVALGVAEMRDEGVGASAALAAATTSPLADLLPTRDLWRHLPRFLRTGEPYARMDGSPQERASEYRGVARALGCLFENAARELAGKLAPGAGRILDIGAGSGVWSLEMCARSPTSRVTALDLPDVLPAFLERADRHGLADRVDATPGDFHSSELPVAAFDRIVLANVLHLEPPSRARSLMLRSARALMDGGELVVIDCVDEGEPVRRPARAVYALHLAMRTNEGRVHPRAEIERWARDAGLSEGELVALDARPWSLAALVHRTRR
jgi:SAM-dependent methyltransferase